MQPVSTSFATSATSCLLSSSPSLRPSTPWICQPPRLPKWSLVRQRRLWRRKLKSSLTISRKANTLSHSLAPGCPHLLVRISSQSLFICGRALAHLSRTGIPDFRGSEGQWTLRAQGRQRSAKDKVVSTLQAVPTQTHMALVELQNRGVLKYLVSQNCDGLYRRSGILPVSFSVYTTCQVGRWRMPFSIC